MTHYVFQQNAFASCEEMMSSISISDRKDPLVCPKPRRLGRSNHAVNEPIRSLRWQLSHQADLCDSRAGTELLDIFLTKGGYGAEQSPSQVFSSSPPFFSGSPPSRASNPLIQDARFGDEQLTQFSHLPVPVPIPSGMSSSPSSSTRKGGCARSKFGHKPAAIRIEGFDCLDRDRRNCSIPAVA
ncbi:hypothetical protein BVC80_8781g6 [Macleaya cordata]|uniref:Uncharacterized protein n=1 Tax=Macleaya cordata TaxID=56857 RepID=A0A200PXM0_MACCD|nr:hypothetical protein BVC80_8781g6 [Macleaya cordata]